MPEAMSKAAVETGVLPSTGAGRATSSKFRSVCHRCGGHGLEGGCPRCGLTVQQKVMRKVEALGLPLDIIPAHYQGKLWTRIPATEGVPAKFVDFDNKLETIHKIYMDGLLPHYSVFISGPRKTGKMNFAYSCMQLAAAKTIKIAPMLSTSDWRRLYRVSQMDPMYKLYGHYRWDDLISREVVFMRVDHSEDRYDVFGLLKEVFDTRASMGKATMVISDYKLEDLVSRWGSEEYAMIHDSDPDRDLYRYPVILQRFE